ncbi:MAG: hypothetical protein QG656_963 [Candidatus Hydrogenedentes bacterium]|nr:hypothetical protein [Candidatus Hydrogenedentota bacterium]
MAEMQTAWLWICRVCYNVPRRNYTVSEGFTP